MTAPAFLASTHRYLSVADVADVADIITAVRDELLNQQTPAWTEPSAGLFKSPVDAQGRWFDVALSAVDTDTLQAVVRNQVGTTVATVRIDINASPGNEVKIYSGQYHLWIDSMRATPENFRSGLLDLSPQTQDAWASVTYAGGHRNSSGTATNNTTVYVYLASGAVASGSVFPGLGGGNTCSHDLNGNLLYFPIFLSNGSLQMLGRMYQALWGSTDVAMGSEVSVPIDTGVTAKFRRTGVVTAASAAGLGFFIRAD